MDPPHQSDRGTEVKSDDTMSLPDPQAKKTLAVFYKPIVVSADLTTCKTLEDVDKAVRSQPEFESYDANVFKDIHCTRLADGTPFTCEELGLTDRDCSKRHFPALTITPRPPPERYDVHIYHIHHGDLSDNSITCTVNVACEDTVARLQELVEERTGFATDSQKLYFMGEKLLPADHILAHKIIAGSRVLLMVEVALYLKYYEMSTRMVTFSHTPLYGILSSFANDKRLDPATLLFQIIQASGDASQESQAWLPDRTRLFGVEEAKGTIWQNGFRDGDEIRVFELNKRPTTKRGLEGSQETTQSTRKKRRAAASTTGLSK
ncbi:hypothetical protein G647_01542 [Cladophialophora carrionii CBS 160.54]|uniref:Ubiquitin-like domain-containing protein n=1 Tax=Cladophialophora carrionii CBS 160.54 TaxID=1279043 RepID=V9DQ97_9EURO|nr:uncharacterized protein G647_01542 [Cladophialophora carrionii CBS 160.54]ETI29089.1 hypothetical protein G647_01542 [Cladophialophora carrionii CBS 160.54]